MKSDRFMNIKLYCTSWFKYFPFLLFLVDILLSSTVGANRFFAGPFNQWWQLALESPLLVLGAGVGIVGVTKTKGFKQWIPAIGFAFCLLYLCYVLDFAIRASSPYFDWGA